MAEGFYDTSKSLSEYLLFHYGKPAEVLPWCFGPSDALGYPIRCVSKCVATERLPAHARALDLGCAVGRPTFELARHCTNAIGIDLSDSFHAPPRPPPPQAPPASPPPIRETSVDLSCNASLSRKLSCTSITTRTLLELSINGISISCRSLQ